MKKIAFMFLLGLMFTQLIYAQSLAGKWHTFSDKTGEQESVVDIFKKSNGKYYGKITHIVKAEDRNNICDKCPEGYSKKEPVLGLEIMRNFVQIEGNKWEGKILDPDEGKIYSCVLSVIEKGKKLKVRGYIGITLLGRTQFWVRSASK